MYVRKFGVLRTNTHLMIVLHMASGCMWPVHVFRQFMHMASAIIPFQWTMRCVFGTTPI